MYKVSHSSVQMTLQQAFTLHKHGSFIELWGKDLQKRNDHLVQSSGQSIEESGKFIQQKAQESSMYAQLAQTQTFCSKDLYEQATKAQLEAKQAYIQVLTAYIPILQKTLLVIEQNLTNSGLNS